MSQENVLIKVKYESKFANPIEQAHEGEWIDLRLVKDYELQKGDFKYLDLGVRIELPEGYEAIVAPRSSTCKSTGLIQANSIGVIDNQYHGTWYFPAYATRDVFIKAGSRIAQFRVQKIQPKIEIQEIEFLEDTRGGLGSTGGINAK
ncbi:deoxyuridine 5'-triphosphate nucleotidohydrolase [Massilibacteroides sp.]|uniref:dUTP diphosphatase n=1 Tax=Massilibacteroides sp. TaxID=2034766 RepID=UPI002620236A|nr:deoxyuridine 5'-triphosphate nucleotidohydrolase [Massilibacteroides sp.]MDD4516562.1 deoxyuridine 5'-triphosphate nucleotidohydrolase [Massilibacteroides sp.]